MNDSPYFQIHCTPNGIKQYPLHKHNRFEIMIYLSGNGYMKTNHKNYKFSPGTIIIIPPETEHGSVSENGFKNISIIGDFGQYLLFEKPVITYDNEYKEGQQLAEIIYKNRSFGSSYLSSLCTAFVHFILQSLNIDSDINAKINKIIYEITNNFHDSDINLNKLLLESGYAKNYIRVRFKEITGLSPTSFLRNIRIQHACYLIEIYGKNIPLNHICEQCGYTDYIYFSKKFKEVMGISPNNYRHNKKI